MKTGQRLLGGIVETGKLSNHDDNGGEKKSEFALFQN